MKQVKAKYDFKAFGQAIKEARKAKGISRNQLADRQNIAPRYIASIENSGQHPSLQIFYELVTFFDISVDQIFFPAKAPDKTTQRRQLDELLNGIDSNWYDKRNTESQRSGGIKPPFFHAVNGLSLIHI